MILLVIVFLISYTSVSLVKDVNFREAIPDNILSRGTANIDTSEMREDRRDFAQNLAKKHFPDNLNKAVEICKNLKKRGNCMYYLSRSTGVEAAPNVSMARDKCRIIGEGQLGACFDGFGYGTAQKLKNVTKSLEICDGAGRYRNACYDGVSSGLGMIFYNNFTRMREICSKYPSSKDDFENDRRRCYDGFGSAFAIHFEKTSRKMYRACKNASQNYEGWCFKALGYHLTQVSLDKVSRNMNICQEFGNYTYRCLMGVGDAVGEYIALRDVERSEDLCMEFEERSLQENCIEEIGYAVGRIHMDELEKGIDKCKLLEDKNQLDCLKGLKKMAKRQFSKSENFHEKCERISEESNKISCQ